jgi:hypothetical protein
MPTQYCNELFGEFFNPVVDTFRKLVRMAMPDASEEELQCVFVSYRGSARASCTAIRRGTKWSCASRSPQPVDPDDAQADPGQHHLSTFLQAQHAVLRLLEPKGMVSSDPRREKALSTEGTESTERG